MWNGKLQSDKNITLKMHAFSGSLKVYLFEYEKNDTWVLNKYGYHCLTTYQKTFW